MKTISLNGSYDLINSKTPGTPLTQVTLVRLVDDGHGVVAVLEELTQPIRFWGGDMYDIMGDWTQAQAEKMIVHVLTKMMVVKPEEPKVLST